MNDAPVRWDPTAERLIAFAQRSSYDALPQNIVHETKRRVIDTFASALGAYDEPVCAMARRVASRYRSDSVARVWGSGITVAPEYAAFANGVMARALDVSDTYLGRSRGHPSDMMSGLVAAGEIAGADGKALIAAIVLAYDVYCSFCRSVDINAKGWDQPVYGVLGCSLGAARLLSLTPQQTGQALSLALTPNMALAQTRRGSLSSWKGCAGANASRNALFAALLAKEGFTGPSEVFEGEGGLWAAIGRFDWALPETHMIAETHTKPLPVCYHGQSAVLAALQLRNRVEDPGAIEEVLVEGYATAKMMMASDATRWAPATRETADHSLPYCVAVALLDGEVTQASFADERLRDPRIAGVMQRVKVAEDPQLTAQYPEGAPGRVTLRTRSGQMHVAEVRYPRGHEKNPMTDGEIERKFRDLSAARLGGEGCERALEQLWQLERAGDVRRLAALFAAPR